MWRRFFERIINLRDNADFEKTKGEISEGVTLRGYNLWMLVCAATLASIGLDTNSAAIIIGAMLISPLMSPILGVGFSIAILDTKLLGRSARNLGIAVVISLVVSTLFFLITPLQDPTSEEQSRTYPTLLDVMVAFFGGVAGIVSSSRSKATNAIPGVAIATALMPPLCTAGFGIATMRWQFFAGAFYLFFINAVFISMATFLVVKYLHFPQRDFATDRRHRRYSFWFATLSIVVLLPSIYFLYTVYQREHVRRQLTKIVLTPIRQQGNQIIQWEMADHDTAIWVKVFHSGVPLSDSLKDMIAARLKSTGLSQYELKPYRVNMTKEEVNTLSADVARQMLQQLQLEKITAEDTTRQTAVLPYPQLPAEVKTAFPFVDTLYNGWLMLHGAQGRTDTLPVVFYRSRRPGNRNQQAQLYRYLKVRLQQDTVVLVKQ